MNTPTSYASTLVVCIEGPSAVGKSTLAAALARDCGAAFVPELDASAAPPRGSSGATPSSGGARGSRRREPPSQSSTATRSRGSGTTGSTRRRAGRVSRRSPRSTARGSSGARSPSQTCTWRSRPPKRSCAAAAPGTPRAHGVTSRSTCGWSCHFGATSASWARPPPGASFSPRRIDRMNSSAKCRKPSAASRRARPTRCGS